VLDLVVTPELRGAEY